MLTDAINLHALKGADAPRAVFDRGVAYDSLGNSVAAIADYTEALRLDPSLSAARNNRGNAYRRIGQLENAKRDYLAALMAPGGARQYPCYGLGLIALQTGDQDGARSYFQKALAADPSYVPAARSLTALNGDSMRKAPAKPATFVAPMSRTVAEVHLRPAISDAGNVVVQLGAFRDAAAANAGWAKAVAAADGALDGLNQNIVVADLPGRGRFWRLRVAFPGYSAAHSLCARLVARGQNYIPAPN